MKNKTFYCGLLLVSICILMVSCLSKSDINRDDEPESQELYRIKVGGKCGFINENGKLMIEPQFDRAYWYFTDGVCFATVGERQGLINSNGEFVVELDPSINWIRKFNNGVANFLNNNGMCGVIDKSGRIILPAIYQDVFYDEDNGFIVKDTLGNFGYVNHEGKFIVPCQYDDIKGFEDGLMAVMKSNKYGYVDTTGTLVIDMIYNEARNYGDGLARVMDGEKWQFIDHDGDVVTTIKYDEILSDFKCNRAFVKSGNAIDLIDNAGTIISTIDADSVYSFHDGYATFKKNGICGKIDTNGTVVIQPKYERLFETNSGLSVFVKNDKQGMIDTTGNVIVDALHDAFFNICECTLLQFEDDNWARGTYYDRKGNLIWKDMTGNKFVWPKVPTKKDYVAYFDSRLSELDPIEGVYYVTFSYYSVNRNNDHLSSNGTESRFVAILPSGSNKEGYFVTFISDDDPYRCWIKKFVSVGESNAYAVVNSGENTNWADDGTLFLEDPYKFEVTLRQGGNNSHNWYVQCEFIKDYPSSSEYEQVQKAEWTGTGFAIADGYIVTNYHVTNGAKTIKVRGVNGDMKDVYKAYVVASDRDHDLAIIKIVDKKFNGFEDIPYCIGKSIPEVGDDIFVLGYPMINTMGQEIKLTNGIISSGSGYKGEQSMYQISAAVQHGNSGGPLFDNEGNVIGIICAKHADAENANYAIKVSYLYSLVTSSGLGIKIADNNKVKSRSLSQKVKQVKPFVYLIECRSH